jgi:hypothetical protein
VKVGEVPESGAEGEPGEPKDKKKMKSKKIHSSSTHIAPEVSMPEKHDDGPKDMEDISHQDPPPQDKTSGQRTESSNSCLDPPPFKVFSKSYLFIFFY